MSLRRTSRAAGIDSAPVIYGTAFVMAFSVGLVNLGLVFHARETLGFSPVRVGWLPSTHALVYVVACLGLSPRLQHFSPRRLVIVALTGLGLCFAALSLVRAYAWLLLLCALYGLSLSLFWPFLMGWLSMGREGGRLGKSLSRYNFAWCGATVFSPYVCGRLSEMGTRLPLWLGAGLAAAAACLVIVLTPALGTGAGAEPAPSSHRPEVLPSGRSTRLRYSAWLGLAVAFFGMGVFAAAFPVAAREQLGLSMRAVGFLLLVRAFFNMAAFLGLGFTEKWHFRLSPMLMGQLVGVLAFAGLVWAVRPAMIGLLLALTGVSVAFSYTISVFHGVSGAKQRSTRMAIHEAMLSVGLVFGGAGGAALYDRFGLAVVFAATAILLLAATLLQALLGALALRRDRLDTP